MVATAYAYLIAPTHASNFTAGVRKFSEFDPHR